MDPEDSNFGDAGALFQIAEPSSGESRPSKRRSGFGIGVDLGTTHSVVAWGPGQPAKAIADAQGRTLLPSVVAYLDENQVLVGHEAVALASDHPTRVIASAKRFLGRSRDDLDFEHPYHLEGDEELIRFEVGRERPVNPIEVSAQVLRALKERAEAHMGQQIDGAVVTVPAYFNEAQRQATKDACRLAGLPLYRLLAEPTAAAIAYGLDKKERGLFAVYDLGGGTFDVSVLRLRDGVFQVLATGGDTALGGDDFDRAIASHWQREHQLESGRGVSHPALLAAARRAKEELSTCEEVQLTVQALGNLELKLDREALEPLIAPWIKKSIRVCRRALKDAGVSVAELDDVVLVGGSTRVPQVRAAVGAFFGRSPHDSLDADLAVAMGAAVQADLLSGTAREGMTLLDVAPLSLGLETMGGMVEVIIPRNATLPIAARQTFTNYSQAQTAMKLNVVQGERELARDCRSVASFELKGLPSLPPGLARVEVSFELDADGLLTVGATELTTMRSMRVEVKPSYALAPEEVDRLVHESLEHAESDFEARNRAEARVELGRVLVAVKRAVEEHGEDAQLLPPPEGAALLAQLERCAKLLEGGSSSLEELRAGLRELEACSEPFARRRMEHALRSQMQGSRVEEIQANLQENDDSLDRRRGGHSATMIEPDDRVP